MSLWVKVREQVELSVQVGMSLQVEVREQVEVSVQVQMREYVGVLRVSYVVGLT